MKFFFKTLGFVAALLIFPVPGFAQDAPPLPLLKSGDGVAPEVARGARRVDGDEKAFSSSRPLPRVVLPPKWDGRRPAIARKPVNRAEIERRFKAGGFRAAANNRDGASTRDETPAGDEGEQIDLGYEMPEHIALPLKKDDIQRPARDKKTARLSSSFKLTRKIKALGRRVPRKMGRIAVLSLRGAKRGRRLEVAIIPLPIKRPDDEPDPRQGGSAAKVLQDKIEPTPVVMPVPELLTKWDDAEIASAQQACKSLLADIDAEIKPLPSMRKGRCGTPAPVKVSGVGLERGKGLKIKPAATVNCKYAARLARWVKKSLQPLAEKHLKSRVKTIHNVSSYACRNRYNAADTKLSEHALANALDIGALTLEDGTRVSVLDHWPHKEDEPEEDGAESAKTVKAKATKPKSEKVKAMELLNASKAAFLQAVHKSACKAFVVVLGPEANAAHKNHFHFDLGRYKVCE